MLSCIWIKIRSKKTARLELKKIRFRRKQVPKYVIIIVIIWKPIMENIMRETELIMKELTECQLIQQFWNRISNIWMNNQIWSEISNFQHLETNGDGYQINGKQK